MLYLLTFSLILAQSVFLVAVFIVRDKFLKQRTCAVGTDCHPTLVTALPIMNISIPKFPSRNVLTMMNIFDLSYIY